MPYPLADAAARLAALVALTRRLDTAAADDRAQILDDAVRAAGGNTDPLAEDFPAIYEFQIHGVTGAGFSRDDAAENFHLAAQGALSGCWPNWAALIVRCPVPGIPLQDVLVSAATVLATSHDPQAKHAARLALLAYEQRLYPEQSRAA